MPWSLILHPRHRVRRNALGLSAKLWHVVLGAMAPKCPQIFQGAKGRGFRADHYSVLTPYILQSSPRRLPPIMPFYQQCLAWSRRPTFEVRQQGTPFRLTRQKQHKPAFPIHLIFHSSASAPVPPVWPPTLRLRNKETLAQAQI